jgi:flagellar biosynthesis protein FlhB
VADTEDKESKTEEATEKRLSDAIEKGNVPFSRDLVLFGSLAAIFAALALSAAWTAQIATGTLRLLFANAGEIRLDDQASVSRLGLSLIGEIGTVLLPIFAIISAGTVIASLMQNAPSMAGERITPQMSRISPLAGWKRLFGKQGLAEFLRATIKLVAVSAVTFLVLRNDIRHFVASLGTDPAQLPAEALRLVLKFMTFVTLLALLLGLGDFVWTRIKWRRDLRMTRHEIKEEMKQSEGDPQIKARIRNIGRQRASRRMLTKVPEASMVVVNPTHYAVALRYAKEQGGAPIVVAKGIDFMALKIREIASTSGVPLVEDKPLARALYDKVEIDTQIPPEFYRAVAEIIHYLHGRRKLPARRQASPGQA